VEGGNAPPKNFKFPSPKNISTKIVFLMVKLVLVKLYVATFIYSSINVCNMVKYWSKILFDEKENIKSSSVLALSEIN